MMSVMNRGCQIGRGLGKWIPDAGASVADHAENKEASGVESGAVFDVTLDRLLCS